MVMYVSLPPRDAARRPPRRRRDGHRAPSVQSRPGGRFRGRSETRTDVLRAALEPAGEPGTGCSTSRGLPGVRFPSPERPALPEFPTSRLPRIPLRGKTRRNPVQMWESASSTMKISTNPGFLYTYSRRQGKALQINNLFFRTEYASAENFYTPFFLFGMKSRKLHRRNEIGISQHSGPSLASFSKGRT